MGGREGIVEPFRFIALEIIRHRRPQRDRLSPAQFAIVLGQAKTGNSVRLGAHADIRQNDDGPAPQLTNFRSSALRAVGVQVVVYRHIAALARQLERNPLPDAFGGAGDQRSLTFEKHW